eukprot:1159148-Pelagomonas_calceolata.AAC.12
MERNCSGKQGAVWGHVVRLDTHAGGREGVRAANLNACALRTDAPVRRCERTALQTTGELTV